MPKENRNRSTKRPAVRCLNRPDDIEAAIDWRLAGLSIAELEAIADALRPFADDFREDRPEVAALLADLHQPGDRRSEWSLACAVLAWDSLRRWDILTFGITIAEVASAMRQSKRGQKRGSPLTPIIEEFRRNQPGATSEQAFEHFIGIAEASGNSHEVIADYSPVRDSLILHDGPEISRESFCRQYRRI